jgi:hypothetical protein
MNKQRGSVAIMVVLLFVVIVVVGVVLVFKKQLNPSLNPIGFRSNTSQGEGMNAINSDQDLTAVEKDLDALNLDQIDSELQQNDTDAATF